MADYDWFSPTPAQLERNARFARHKQFLSNGWSAVGFTAVIGESEYGGRHNDEKDPDHWSIVSLCCDKCGCYVNPKKFLAHVGKCPR